MQNRWPPPPGRLASVEFFNAELNSSGAEHRASVVHPYRPHQKISALPPFKRLHFEPHHRIISPRLQEGSPTMTPAERESFLQDLDHSRESLLRTVDGL